MGEVLKLPESRSKKALQKNMGNKSLPQAIADPNLRAALMTLHENDENLARAAKLNLMEVFKRLETLEAVVFAQSVLIADLRGKPLTPQQREKISRVLQQQGKLGLELEIPGD
jgi:hypothetical protein